MQLLLQQMYLLQDFKRVLDGVRLLYQLLLLYADYKDEQIGQLLLVQRLGHHVA
jgi:hypothetical protein